MKYFEKVIIRDCNLGSFAVLESSDILYGGISRTLLSLGADPCSIHRIEDISLVDKNLYYNQSNIFIISAGRTNKHLLGLLKLLIAEDDYKHRPPIILLLEKTNKSIEMLAIAFGIFSVLTYSSTEEQLLECLIKIKGGIYMKHHKRLLSNRERYVVQHLLAGETLSQIATFTKRTVQTVSAQQLSAVRKLSLNNLNGLQQLASYMPSLKEA